jgi:hypothetical protein
VAAAEPKGIQKALLSIATNKVTLLGQYCLFIVQQVTVMPDNNNNFKSPVTFSRQGAV